MREKLTTLYELDPLTWSDAVVDVEQLPTNIVGIDFMEKMFGTKFFAVTTNGIVKQLVIPSDCIPNPRSAIAALTLSPDTPIRSQAVCKEIIAILNAVDCLEKHDLNISHFLGVDEEDFRLTTKYRSEIDSRIVHHPLTEEEQDRLVKELGKFICCAIQLWIARNELPQGIGPTFLKRRYVNRGMGENEVENFINHDLFSSAGVGGVKEQKEVEIILKDVLTLIASTSSNTILRESASEVRLTKECTSTNQGAQGWGGIRQRRRKPVASSTHNDTSTPPRSQIDEIKIWANQKRLVDENIINNEIQRIRNGSQTLLVGIYSKYIAQFQLLNRKKSNCQISKPTLSSVTTRAPPSIDDVTDINFLSCKPLVPESVTIASFNHQLERMRADRDSQSLLINSLREEFRSTRCKIHSKEAIISELTNHCIRMKAHLFAYADEIEDGAAIEQYDVAKMWTELEKLRIERKMENNFSKKEIGDNYYFFDEIRKRDEIIDLLNFVLIKLIGENKDVCLSSEINFAISKIRDLMRESVGNEMTKKSTPTTEPPPSDSKLLDEYTREYFPV